MTEPIFQEIHAFNSVEHYQSFIEQVSQWLLDGKIRPAEVTQVYASQMFEETWYQTESGEFWRLVSPEPPFKGVFERVREAGRDLQ